MSHACIVTLQTMLLVGLYFPLVLLAKNVKYLGQSKYHGRGGTAEGEHQRQFYLSAVMIASLLRCGERMEKDRKRVKARKRHKKTTNPAFSPRQLTIWRRKPVSVRSVPLGPILTGSLYLSGRNQACNPARQFITAVEVVL